MDELDREIAAVLQVNGRSGWGQIANVVGCSKDTAARRARRMLEAGEIRIVAIADPVRCGLGYWVLVQIRCEVGEVERVAHTLTQRNDVRYLALTTGAFDILIEMIVPTQERLTHVLTRELPLVGGIAETTTRTILRNFKMAYDWSRALLPADLGEVETVPSASEGVYALDEVEERLYGALVEDGRRSYAELAQAAGVSESVAWRKVNALLDRGCLKIATLVRPERLGYGVECICWIRVRLSELEEIAEHLARMPEVRYISATMDFSDLICEVVLKAHEDLYRFCTETLAGLSGVQEVNANLKLRTLKQAYVTLDDVPEAGVEAGT